MSKAGRGVEVLIVSLALALGVAAAVAAEVPALELGAQVRATLRGPERDGTAGSKTSMPPEFRAGAYVKTVTGKLLGLTGTDITLDALAHKAPLVIPRQSVASLELNLQQGRRNRGALIGIGAAVATGLLIGAASGDDRRDDPDSWIIPTTAGEKAAIMAVVLAPVGALIGALASPGARWQTIPPDRIQLGFDASRRGASGVCVTMPF